MERIGGDFNRNREVWRGTCRREGDKFHLFFLELEMLIGYLSGDIHQTVSNTELEFRREISTEC